MEFGGPTNSMDAASPNAVFLSYAREDTAAVKAIAEALRAQGVEVWFDQNELRGGDAWDDKIRGQIKACALFLPIISANTNARLEGYFRREWKQAVERTHDMADELPFLLPVVVDDTSELAAKVPERFRRSQWMRVRGYADAQALAERVRSLLTGQPAAGAPTPAGSVAQPAPAPKPRARRPVVMALVTLAAMGVLAVGFYLRRVHGTAGSQQGVVTIANFPTAPKLRGAMAQLTGVDAIPEDFQLANDIAQEIYRQDPTNAEAVTVLAFSNDFFLLRGFDQTIERRSTALRLGERAVQLDSSSPYAHAALGMALQSQTSVALLPRARDEYDAAIKLKPDEPYFYRMRDTALFGDPKVSTQVAMDSSIATARRFPGDALAHYDLARHYRDVGDIADMEREIDRCLEITPIVNAYVWKARLALWVRGDPEEMLRILRQVPARGRSLERTVMGQWIYAMATGKSQEVLDALDGLPETWVNDFDYVGPKELLKGVLLNARGDHDLAKVSLESALAEIQKWKALHPSDTYVVEPEFWCLLELGRNAEAEAKLKVTNEALLRPYHVGFGQSWWFSSIPANLIQGNRAFALTLLREASSRGAVSSGTVLVSRNPTDVIRSGYPTDYREMIGEMMRVDPRMAPWRRDPEILAILREGGSNRVESFSDRREGERQ